MARKKKVQPVETTPATSDEAPNPRLEIKLDERDWLMSKYLIECTKSAEARHLNAIKDLDIFQREITAQKAQRRNTIQQTDNECTHAKNELNGFLVTLERRYGINLSNYTWRTDGTLLYSGDPELIDQQEPSVKRNDTPTNPPDVASENQEAAFHANRVV